MYAFVRIDIWRSNLSNYGSPHQKLFEHPCINFTLVTVSSFQPAFAVYAKANTAHRTRKINLKTFFP